MRIKISDIIISEDRQRKEFGDIEELAKSIEQSRGVIQPVVIDESNNLIAGERRVRACLHLGHKSIEARRIKDLSASEKHLIELEENVKRKALTWQEHVDAVKRYHEIRLAENKEHQELDTALELGLSPTKLNKDLLIAAAITEDPTLKDIDKYQNVYNASVRKKQRQKDLALAGIDVGLAPPKPTVRRAELLNMNFAEWAEEYDGPPFDFIHCDFPFGINIDKSGDALSLDAHEQYKDAPEVFDLLINVLKEHGDRFLGENVHIMFWTAAKNLSMTRRKLGEAGLRWQAVPLIWHKNDGRGVAPDPRFNPRHVYEIAILAYKGHRQINKVKDDVCPHPVVNQLHRNEKPRKMLEHFFEMFVDRHTRMLDPTCGCGNSVLVAEEMGAMHALGIELSPSIYEVAKENLKL